MVRRFYEMQILTNVWNKTQRTFKTIVMGCNTCYSWPIAEGFQGEFKTIV